MKRFRNIFKNIKDYQITLLNSYLYGVNYFVNNYKLNY